MLTGCFDRVLDDKLRLAIPKRLRDVIISTGSREVYLAPGTDGSVAVYPEKSFHRLADQLDHAPPHGRNVRTFSRLFYAKAQSCELDGHGRIRIPTDLIKFAALTRDIVLIGVRDHLEIWDRMRWSSYVDQAESDYDSIAELAFNPPLTPPDSNHSIENREPSDGATMTSPLANDAQPRSVVATDIAQADIAQPEDTQPEDTQPEDAHPIDSTQETHPIKRKAR